jgi:adenine-specific DNA-methyltransferase
MKKTDLILKLKQLQGISDEEKAYLINLVNTKKKYGLMWEDKPEDVEEQLRENLPVLKEVKDKAIVNDIDYPNHILIEGDNLHALTALNFTHEGRVDTIYIDPPYNTGAKNWLYNNDYVDKDDAYRHSKFISFMEHRINLAKRLLSPKGILICAIDDYEVHNVRHLLDEVFGQENRLGTIVVVHNPRGRNDDRFIATMHEYMLFYAKDFNQASINFFPLNDKDIAAYNKTDGISSFNETGFIRTGNNSLRTERPNLFYPIYYNILKDKLQLEEDPNCIKLLPINGKGEERTWRWGKETFQDLKDSELFVRPVKGEYKVFKKRRITNIEGKKPKTVWTESKYDASSNGIMLLQEIFDGKNPFPYPKSFYALLDTLQISTNEDSIILDFFAGSGTTLHATMSLNASDGGNRQCILVTNNENNICEEVTYERNKRVIKGYKKLKGESVNGLLRNNLRYYQCAYVPREPSTKNKLNLTKHAIELLCIKEDCYTDCTSDFVNKNNSWLAVFSNGLEQYLVVIFDDEKIEEGVEALQKLVLVKKPKEQIKVYVFSNGQYPFTEEFEEVLPYITLCALPDAIYKAYQNVLPKRHRQHMPELEDPTAEDVENTILYDPNLNLFNQAQ